MATVSKEFTFDAAHRLTSREAGACGALHGHEYRVKVTVSGPIDPETRMVMNFRELNIGDGWDHATILNADDPVLGVLHRSGVKEVCGGVLPIFGEPTAENIACVIFRNITQDISGVPAAVLESVTVWETPRCCATVTKEDLRDE